MLKKMESKRRKQEQPIAKSQCRVGEEGERASLTRFQLGEQMVDGPCSMSVTPRQGIKR